MKLVSVLLLVLSTGSFSFAGYGKQTCKQMIIEEAEAKGYEVERVSIRASYNGKDNDNFQGYSATIKTASGKTLGARTNRSCSHIRVFKFFFL